MAAAGDDDWNVYLDVDGVINAVTHRTPSWGWSDEGTVVNVNKFSIRYSTELVAALHELALRPNVHIFWLTTWEQSAPVDLCPAIGLNGGDWHVLTNEPRHEPTTSAWWKLNALREHLPEGRRAIWIDDDIKFDRAAQEWLAENPMVTPVSPNTEVGLTLRQMRNILAATATT